MFPWSVEYRSYSFHLQTFHGRIRVVLREGIMGFLGQTIANPQCLDWGGGDTGAVVRIESVWLCLMMKGVHEVPCLFCCCARISSSCFLHCW